MYALSAPGPGFAERVGRNNQVPTATFHQVALGYIQQRKIGDVLANATRTHKLALSGSMLDRRHSYDILGPIILPTYSRPTEVLLKAARVVQKIQFIHSLPIVARNPKSQDLTAIICEIYDFSHASGFLPCVIFTIFSGYMSSTATSSQAAMHDHTTLLTIFGVLLHCDVPRRCIIQSFPKNVHLSGLSCLLRPLTLMTCSSPGTTSMALSCTNTPGLSSNTSPLVGFLARTVIVSPCGMTSRPRSSKSRYFNG